MATYGRSLLDTKDAPPSGTVQFPVRRLNVAAGYLLRFFANWTMTAGSGAGTIPPDSLQRFMKRIRLTVDGQTLQNLSAVSSRLLSRFFDPSQLEQTPPTSLAAGTSEAVECNVFVFTSMPHSDDPDSFALATRYTENPVLEIETGTAADCVIGEDGSPAFTTPKIELTEVPILGVPDADVYDLVAVQTYSEPVTVTNETFPLQLKNQLPGTEIRAVLIEALSGGSNGANHTPNDALIRSVRFNIGGGDVVEKTTWDVLRNFNKKTYNLPTREAGAVLLDAAEDKDCDPGELWDVEDGPTPFLELNVNPQAGENLIRVTVVSVYRADD